MKPISERKTVAVDKELAEKVIKIAKRKGRTIYSYINSVIKLAIKAEKSGMTLHEQTTLYKYFLHGFKSNFILVPLPVFLFALEVNLEHDRERVFIEWRNFGIWYAEFTKVKHESIEEMQEFETRFFNVTNAQILKLEMERIRDSDTDEKKKINFQVRLISTSDSIDKDTLLCYYYFFQGFFENYDFTEKNKIILESIISFEVWRQNHATTMNNYSTASIKRKLENKMLKKPRERKIIAVSKELADELIKIAKKHDVSLFSYFNENILQSVIISEGYGISLGAILREFEYLRLLYEINVMFFPASVSFFLSRLASEHPKWTEVWRNTGRWACNYLKIRFKTISKSLILELARETFHSNSRIDMNVEIVESPDKDDQFDLKFYGTSLTKNIMDGISSYYEGFYEELGYQTIGREIAHAICILHLKKKN
ncbi:MAG: hypothetical protein ACXQS8_05400 [Candidatus Helarchaeales archaeon]